MSAEILNATAVAEKSWPAVFADLVKARLTGLVLLTTFVGFYLGERGSVDFLQMFHALFGTALVAGGAAALNQLLEREYDVKMLRTASRPLPSGRLKPVTVAVFGGVCSVAGLIYLASHVQMPLINRMSFHQKLSKRLQMHWVAGRFRWNSLNAVGKKFKS